MYLSFGSDSIVCSVPLVGQRRCPRFQVLQPEDVGSTSCVCDVKNKKTQHFPTLGVGDQPMKPT